MSRLVTGSPDAIFSATATPPFMSQVPSPCSRPPSRRAGRLSFTGTVSRGPAISPRSPRAEGRAPPPGVPGRGHLGVAEAAQRLRDGVGDRLLVLAHRLDVHELLGQR